jgi:hypothetical protein
MTKLKTIFISAAVLAGYLTASAEQPGEFRPQPVLNPKEIVHADGKRAEAPDEFPASRAPLVNDAHRKPKLANPGTPALRGDELVFNAGWEMIEAPKLHTDGTAISQPGVDTADWYDATVPGTVLTTLVNEGVYPDPYFGLNNRLIPENLNKQDYWYRTAFTVPKSFAGRELTLQFNGINYYAEVWFNGQYLGHVTGAFIRGKFDVTKLVRTDGQNVLAVMITPPPDPGLLSEESVKFGPRDNGGALCMDGPTFECTEGWDWIPMIRDRDAGIWQDVVLRATGPVAMGDPQVITELPLPDTSRADVTIKTDLHNASDAVQQGALRGSFEGVKFEQPVTLQPGETKNIAFTPSDFPQLTVQHPRLWWPNGYGKPELYHLKLNFIYADGNDSDSTALRFGIREMSYDFEVKKNDGTHERVEFTPVLMRDPSKPVIDNRRYSMVWGPENKARHDAAIIAAGGKIPTTPFHWGQGQETTVALWPGMEDSPALKPAADTNMGIYLVIRVNGQSIESIGGDWGMDDAMKNISRERLEPYIRLEHDAGLNLIRNWAGQSTSEALYDLCDQYGILVWNEFWVNTESHNYAPVDLNLSAQNAADIIKRFRNHPSIALWCSGNESVPPEPLNEAFNKMIYELDGTRYYQPNSRLVNMRNSGPWSNLPLTEYFTSLNQGFSTELGASSIPSAEEMRTMMPAADLWPPGDDWAYHDMHSKGAGSIGSTFERITARYGAPRDLDDVCRKAQMLNYETYRALIEGFNSRLWDDCSGLVIWMSHPSWPSMIWQFYSWDYDPNASLFGVMKGSEPVHIQMNLPDCKIAVINRHAQPLVDVVANATIYDLSGHPEQTRKQTLTAAANACTDAFTLDWPAKGAHFVRLELRDANGKLLSDNFYWHARDERQLQELNSLTPVTLKGKWHIRHPAGKFTIEGKVTNSSQTPALEVRLTLRDAKTGQRILPVYYSDNYFSLLPGESRNFKIETTGSPHDVIVDTDGWNIKSTNL